MFKQTALITMFALSSTSALAEKNPFTKPDGSWVSLSGTVAESSADSFRLDYGEGLITVEMDDWDTWGEAYGLIEGDEVTVYGEVDDDLYELSKIEASSVYVDNLDTYFYASADDEETAGVLTVYEPVELNTTVVSGTVTSVDKDDKRFTIDTDKQKLTVEVDTLLYNPLDKLGFQQVDKGDVVSVTGDLEVEFFNDRVLEADSVTTLIEDKGKKGRS